MSLENIPKQDFCHVRGDSDDFLVTVVEPDPNDINDPPAKIPVDLSIAVDGTPARPVILRMAAKEDPDDSNDIALFFRDSTNGPQEIEFFPQTGLTLGQARILIDKYDTEEGEPGLYQWDLEVSQQDFLRAGASVGTLAIVEGSDLIVGTGTTFLKNAKRGDIIQLLGTNNKPVLIEEIIDDLNIRVNTTVFQNEPALATFEVRRGKHFTAAYGCLELVAGQVGQ